MKQICTTLQVHIAQLEQSIRLLKEKLAVEVVKRQDEFLEQASSMRSAEEAIQVKFCHLHFSEFLVGLENFNALSLCQS